MFIAAVLAAVLVLPSQADAQRRRGGGGGGGGFGGALRNTVGVPALSEETLAPSAIHAGYASLDEASPLDAAEVTYLVSGVETYDTFFRDFAQVKGTLALATHTLGTVNGLLDGGLVDNVFSGSLFTDTLGTAVDVPMESRQQLVVALIGGNFSNAGGTLTEDQFNSVREGFFTAYPDVTQLRETLPATIEGMAALPGRIASLGSTAPGLTTDAPSAFAGPQAVNAPRIISALGASVTDIAALPGDVSDLASALLALTQAQ